MARTFTLSSTAPFIRDNSLYAIAVTSSDRMPDFLELPTFKELGWPELVGTTWFSLSGPKGLAKDVVDRINRVVVSATSTPEIQARFRLGPWVHGTADDSGRVYEVCGRRKREMENRHRAGWSTGFREIVAARLRRIFRNCRSAYDRLQ